MVNNIADLQIINPKKDELLEFLEKIYKIPYSKPEKWQKEIFDFFGKNIFIISIIRRGFKEWDQEFEDYIKKLFFIPMKDEFIWWDSNKCYEDLINVRESVKINENILTKQLPFFFITSAILRKMCHKQINKEDKSFNEFNMGLDKCSAILKNSKTNVKIYEDIFFCISDDSISFNPELYRGDIQKRFTECLKNKFKKGTKNNRKRDPIESRLRHEVFKRDNYTCLECGKTKNETTLHCDHIIPVSQGGSDELDNLQTLCQACNLAKTNRSWKGGNNEVKK